MPFVKWAYCSKSWRNLCYVTHLWRMNFKCQTHLIYIVLNLLLSCSVGSNSLWPHELQHARLPCPSLSPGVWSNSRPLSRWCHPTISSSVAPFSSCPQSSPASESFPLTWESYRLIMSPTLQSDWAALDSWVGGENLVCVLFARAGTLWPNREDVWYHCCTGVLIKVLYWKTIASY